MPGQGAAAFEPESLAGLATGRDPERPRMPFEGRHGGVAAQGGLPRRDFQFVHKIGTFRPKVRVRGDSHIKVKIARGASLGARLSLATQPDTLPFAHPWRDSHFVGLLRSALALE